MMKGPDNVVAFIGKTLITGHKFIVSLKKIKKIRTLSKFLKHLGTVVLNNTWTWGYNW